MQEVQGGELNAHVREKIRIAGSVLPQGMLLLDTHATLFLISRNPYHSNTSLIHTR